jgi:hypothetical protein
LIFVPVLGYLLYMSVDKFRNIFNKCSDSGI